MRLVLASLLVSLVSLGACSGGGSDPDGGDDGTTRRDGPVMAQTATEPCIGDYASHPYPGKTAAELFGVTTYNVLKVPTQIGGGLITHQSALHDIGDGIVVVPCSTVYYSQTIFILPQ